MDEYLFLVLAKLKADRLKLEREQRAATSWTTDHARAASNGQRDAKRFSRPTSDDWRVQS